MFVDRNPQKCCSSSNTLEDVIMWSSLFHTFTIIIELFVYSLVFVEGGEGWEFLFP